MRHVFDQYDFDQSGTIDTSEFKIFCQELGLILRKAELEKLIQGISSSSSQEITFDQFYHWYQSPSENRRASVQVSTSKSNHNKPLTSSILLRTLKTEEMGERAKLLMLKMKLKVFVVVEYAVVEYLNIIHLNI